MYVSTFTADIVDKVIVRFTDMYCISSKGEVLDGNLKVVSSHGFTNEQIALAVLQEFVPNRTNKKYFCWIDGNENNCSHQNLMWTTKPAKGPITCNVYGPYLRKDGRKHVTMTFSELGNTVVVNKRTVSYPKFLKEQELGIPLYYPLTVDHKDCNFTNDDLSNLNIMILSEHAKVDTLRRSPVTGFCMECGIVFELTRAQISNGKRKGIRSGPFCSKTCRGKFTRELQLKRREPKLATHYKNVTYYKEKLV